MKLQRLVHASIGLLCAVGGASGQGVVSQLGGFVEQVDGVPAQAAVAPPSPLSLFLQQEPMQPVFPVASPLGSPQPVAVPPALPAMVAPAGLSPEPPQLPPAFAVQQLSKPKGLLTLRSLRVQNAGADGSKVFFGTGSEFSMGTDSAGNFIVQQASAPKPLLSLDSQDTLRLGSARVEAQALNAVNGISVRGVKQWQLVYSDDFSAMGTGWSREEVSQCGGLFMLGGFCKFSTGEVNKTFNTLPPHKQLKVVAKYHFIDRWIGETGYMKLNIGMNGCAVPVWSEQHTQEAGQNGISLCGNTEVAEGKFSVPVDVTVPHHEDSVSVTFGATIGTADPCDESWGVSAVEIYVRN